MMIEELKVAEEIARGQQNETGLTPRQLAEQQAEIEAQKAALAAPVADSAMTISICSQKTHCGMTDTQLAKLAFSKGWDFEKLKYCDYLYEEDEAVVDAIYELTRECRRIGSVAFDAKYETSRAPTPKVKSVPVESLPEAATPSAEQLIQAIAEMFGVSVREARGWLIERAEEIQSV